MNFCNYGCGKEAQFQMTSGKWCCESHWNKCAGKKNKDSIRKKGKQVPWNKGMTGLKGNPHTEESKRKLSELAKQRNFGGYVKGSGRGKKGTYKGIYCDSSWELAFILYCEHYEIPIKRNNIYFTYVFNDEEKRYLPDFVRTDRENYFIEIKGFFSDKEIAKIKTFPHKLKIYSGNGMKKILKFAEKHYGKDFVRLYGE
jgi:hypothetical protein